MQNLNFKTSRAVRTKTVDRETLKKETQWQRLASRRSGVETLHGRQNLSILVQHSRVAATTSAAASGTWLNDWKRQVVLRGLELD